MPKPSQQKDHPNKIFGSAQIWRSIWNDEFWTEISKKNRFMAWIDLILSASFDDSDNLPAFGNIKIVRGQILTSQDKLASRWGWHRGTVKVFLDFLKSSSRIDFKSSNKFTVITICNYDRYNENPLQNPKKSSTKTGSKTDNKSSTYINTVSNYNKESLTVFNKPDIINPELFLDEKNSFSVLEKKQYSEFMSWLQKNAPRILKMKEIFTIDQFVKMKNLPKDQISKILLAMHNYEPLIKKNVSAYLTFKNWHARDFENSAGKLNQAPVHQIKPNSPPLKLITK